MMDLMKRMQKRSSTLPDADRKKAAEQVALKLLEAMGDESSDDETGGSDDETGGSVGDGGGGGDE
jgi:hypothetical protein